MITSSMNSAFDWLCYNFILIFFKKNTYICEAEKLSEYGEDPLILTEDMEVK